MSYTPISSGVYTPTLTDVQNITAHTAYECQWVKIRDIVTVSGQVDIDTTVSSASTRIQISLPIASTFTGTNQCAGNASCAQVAGFIGTISADITDYVAFLQYEIADTSNRSLYFTFTYRIV